MLSEQIKGARHVAGLTQAEFAEKIGKSRVTIGRWESGERQPFAEELPLIAEILKTTVDFLLMNTLNMSRYLPLKISTLEFGKRLCAIRLEKGISRENLSIMINIPISFIINAEEKGISSLSLENYEKLAAVLNTSVAYLLGETDDPSSPIGHQEIEVITEPNIKLLKALEADPMKLSSAKLLSQLNDEQTRKVYEFLRDQKQLGEFLKEKGA